VKEETRGRLKVLFGRYNRNLWIFFAAAVVVVVVLAVFVSPYASSSPDGLEKVAQDKGFAGKGEGDPAWKHSPLPDYSVKGVGNEKASTGLSGLIGVLITLAVATALGLLVYLLARTYRPGSGRETADQE